MRRRILAGKFGQLAREILKRKVDVGRGQFTISLGVFRTEAAAVGRSESLQARGVSGTRVEPRPPGSMLAMLVVRDPPQPAVARMKELQSQYPGSDLRVGSCAPS